MPGGSPRRYTDRRSSHVGNRGLAERRRGGRREARSARGVDRSRVSGRGGRCEGRSLTRVTPGSSRCRTCGC